MTQPDFFARPRDHSRIKSEIVAKYFRSWASVMIGTIKKNPPHYPQRIYYIDLFAGKGRYDDDSPSTPIMILRTAVNDPELQERLISIFNDADPECATSLRQEIAEIDNIRSLKNPPKVFNDVVDNTFSEYFEQIRLACALLFVDPFGYKGLTTRLLHSVIQNWGCDGIFFFNYRRINAAISNPNQRFEDNMVALFGRERLEKLRQDVQGLQPPERENLIIDEFIASLQERIVKYVHKFKFIAQDYRRTSHYLMFATKHKLGYDIMKTITAKYSSRYDDGIPNFTYDPSDERQEVLPLDGVGMLDELCATLLEDFAGRQIRMKEIYEEHNVGRPFLKKNYKDALLKLEREGAVRIAPSYTERRKSTCGDNVTITFPRHEVNHVQ